MKIHRINPALIAILLLTMAGEIFAVQPGSKKEHSSRNPFSLPAGVHLRSKVQSGPAPAKAPEKTPQQKMKIPEIPPSPLPAPLKVKAILIGSHSRLALIERHIVREGDSIGGEKILVIGKDHVVLGQGDKKRTLFLHQSPVHLTVVEK